jgi:hypothetical protein
MMRARLLDLETLVGAGEGTHRLWLDPIGPGAGGDDERAVEARFRRRPPM